MKIKIFTYTFIITGLLMTAQVKVGDNVTTLTNSAMLEIESSTMGLLIPRMTSSQISNITPLTTGLMVYNTTLNCFSFYNGSSWSCIGSSTTSSFTSGSVLFSNGAATTQNNSNLFWDNTNFRLGIGTNTPNAKLTIKGTGSATPATFGTTQSVGNITRMSDNTNLVLDFGGSGSDGAWLQSTSSTNLSINYPLLLNPNGGNVGIGTAVNIYEKLQVNGNIGLGHWADNFATRFVGVSGGGVRAAGMEIENTTLGGNFSQKLHLFTNHYGSNWGRRLTINEDGNVGIGQTDDILEKLTINGNISMGRYGSFSGTRYIGLSDGTNRNVGMEIENTNFKGGNNSQKLHFATHWAGRTWGRKVTINEVGSVGILTEYPRYELEVQGWIGTYNIVGISDKRFKKDVLPLNNSLEKILQLNGVTFNWDRATWKDRNFDNLNHIGFIAQEVEKILPNTVSTSDDEMKTKAISYFEFVPLLVESVKQLNKEIEKLKAGNRNLDKENHIGFIAQEVDKILPTTETTANEKMKTKSIAYSNLIPIMADDIKELKKEITELKVEIKLLKK